MFPSSYIAWIISLIFCSIICIIYSYFRTKFVWIWLNYNRVRAPIDAHIWPFVQFHRMVLKMPHALWQNFKLPWQPSFSFRYISLTVSEEMQLPFKALRRMLRILLMCYVLEKMRLDALITTNIFVSQL